MARTQRGIIDELAGYTIYDPAPGATPADDYFLYGNYTVWGVGLITFGAPTAQQVAWMSTITTSSNLATFPGDWILFYSSVLPYNPGPIEVWGGGTKIGSALLNEQAVRGITSWSIGGRSGTGSFFWSDLNPVNGTSSSDTITGTSIAETINGGDGSDVINGGDGADALFGGPGNDRLIGGLGVDRLFGGTGDDWLEPGTELPATSYNFAADTQIDGGSGFDILALNHSASSRSVSVSGDVELTRPGVTNVEAVALTGSAFADVLIGTANADQLFGGAGYDYLSGGAGNDLLDAGAPSSSSVTTLGAGGTSAANAASLDRLFVSSGGATPSVSLTIAQPARNALGFGAQSPGTFYSFTAANAGDQLSFNFSFGYGFDYFYNFILKDANGVQIDTFPTNVPTVLPHAGIYTLQVSFGRGNSWGASSIDLTLSLENAQVLASNELVGGLGDDTYRVYAPTDQVIELAGQGTDTIESTFSYTLGAGANVENLRLVGTSAINGTGNVLANTLFGNAAANILTGNDGDDILVGGAGNDLLAGGVGNDTSDYSQEAGGNAIAINLGPTTVAGVAPGSARDSFGNVDTFTSIEHFITGSGNDLVIAGTANTFFETGAGNDTLIGGPGTDSLWGGAGIDTVDYSSALAGVTADSYTALSTGVDANIGFDYLSSIEVIRGSAFDDYLSTGNVAMTFYGQGGNDRLNGGNQDDTLIGGPGNDAIHGGTGFDIVDYSRESGTGDVIANLSMFPIFQPIPAGFGASQGRDTFGNTDTLTSIEHVITGAGNDTIVGDQFNEWFEAGAGNDTLGGGFGNDTLTGGAGNDVFRDFALGLNGDTITDFTRGDRIVITDAAAGQTLGWSNGQLTYGSTSITLTNLNNASVTAAAAPQGGVQIAFGGPALVVAGGVSAPAAQSPETLKLSALAVDFTNVGAGFASYWQLQDALL